MREETAFDETSFLGLSRDARRDGYRLGLFAKHLEPDERPLVFLPIRDATLIVTDRRILEFRAHLVVQGSWNVRRFDGFVIERSIPRETVRGVDRKVGPPPGPQPGTAYVDERLVLDTADGVLDILVTRAPRPVLSDADLVTLRAAILAPQAK